MSNFERATSQSGSSQSGDDYVIPSSIKMITDTAIAQATAVGIVLALFAGALASLAQIVAADVDTDETPASWKALRVFLYSAIIFSLSGAFLSLIVIKMCSDLPLAMYQVRFPPYKIRSDGKLSGRLESAGMSKMYKHIDFMTSCMLVLASVSSFTALTFWVALSETITSAGITMGVFGIVFIGVIFASLVAFFNQGWS